MCLCCRFNVAGVSVCGSVCESLYVIRGRITGEGGDGGRDKGFTSLSLCLGQLVNLTSQLTYRTYPEK